MAALTLRRVVIVVAVGVVALAGAALVRLGGGAPGASAQAGGQPVDVSAAGQHARDPQIVMDAAGTAIALWVREGANESVVQSAVRPAGGSWQAPTALSADGRHASSPHIVINARGTAAAVWERLDNGNYIVQAAVRGAGGSWGAVTDLSVPGRACRTGPACAPLLAQRVARPLLPRVAIDRRGSAVAVWERFLGHSSRVQSAVRPVGGRWRAAVDVARFARVGSQDFAGPQVALGSASGEAIAIWTRVRRGGAVVQAASRRDGRWRTPVDVSAGGRYGGVAQVAFDARGDGLALWQLTPRGAGRQATIVQSATRTRGGRWSRPVDVSPSGVDASTPSSRSVRAARWRRGRAPPRMGRSCRAQTGRQPAAGAGRPTSRPRRRGRSPAGPTSLSTRAATSWLRGR